jgi:ATP-dependent helicase/nuclease subunit A
MTTFGSLSPHELAARWHDLWLAVRHVAIEELTNSSPCVETLSLLRMAKFQHDELNRRRDILADGLPRLAAADNPTALLAVLRDATLIGDVRAKRYWGSDDEFASKYKSALQTLRKGLDYLERFMTWDAAIAQDAAHLGLGVLRLAAEVEDRYSQIKRDRRLLDFDDLLVRAHALLTTADHGHLRRDISRNLRLLLVDESQDTNPLQVELITALCGEDGLAAGKLFFVGDFKQSIYRFLGADPRVFHRLREQIGEEGRLPLSESFRSQPAILDFVNAVFCDEFDDYEPLSAKRPQVTPLPGVEFLWALEPNSSRHGNKDLFIAKEADAIARRIAGLLHSKQPVIPEPAASTDEPPLLRPVRPGDIAILFRTLSDVALYEKELARRGLPYYVVGGKAFYAQQEVFDLSNLLRTLVHPADQVSLVGVLRSPFFSLADETLFWLAQSPGGLSEGLFAEALSPQIDENERETVVFAAQTLKRLRAEKDRLSITGLINRALSLTGYDASLVAEFMGERKLANLRKLLDKARVFDQSGFATLADFVVQLSEFESEQPDEGLAALHAETSDVIRLMTIHQAKGLEFPVVIVTDLERPGRSPNVLAAFDSQWGPVVPLPEEPGTQKPLTAHSLYVRQLQDEEDCERTRLFYVATTRAADYLILSSSFENPQEPKGPWAQLVARRFHLDTGTPREPWPEDYPIVEARLAPDPIESSEPVASGASKDLAALIETSDSAPAAEVTAIARDVQPLAADETARRVFSFSQLSGRLQPAEELLDDDQHFTVSPHEKRNADDGMTLGNLVHAMLADIPINQSANVSASAARHAERLLIDNGALIADATRLVQRFVSSPRAAQLAAARTCYREIEFVLAWPPHDDASPHSPLVQGFIDCIYQDGGGAWHIVDYKSHDVAAERIEVEAHRYRLQLGLYALAAEKVLKQPPVTLTLHFLRPGAEISWEWNDAARSQTTDQVTELLARQIHFPDRPPARARAAD